jgi:hypothetical protein
MNPATYYGFLDRIKGNADAIEREKSRLRSIIAKRTSAIEKLISPKSAPSLIHILNVKELSRSAQLVNISISDFMGHARFLRAYAAKVAFQDGEPSEDSELSELLAHCEPLWQACLHLELMDILKDNDLSETDTRRQSTAGMVSLLAAIQGELVYPDQVFNRCRRLYGQFSSQLIEPQLGLSVEQAIRGFERVRLCVADRLDEVSSLSDDLLKIYKGWQNLISQGGSKEHLM